MKKLILIAALFFFALQVNAQEKTADELKTEREQLKSELKSEAYQKRQKKIAELESPSATDVNSIDALAVNAAAILLDVKRNNDLIPELYKRTVGESVDGVTDVTVKKPSLEELTSVATNIIRITQSVTNVSAQVPTAVTDLKSLNPMKAGKALKSVNYSKNVLALLAPELVHQSKMISNLISTVKSSDNF